ncbi:GTPase Era [Fluviispira multicolorata]|uniref:GTPase Era n=1 Tax=Fluviispira multicolorata TaxID=2654512 RepID=A0A833N5K2_9BACT|nr:GTPase Era [Fluviispira multicolorata]KAB8030847.1 GTPase Era [Fluviispira multicolorata]
MNKKCGYIALLGRPNAGKSTFLNAFLGTKLAVVSNKPQTTRNKILGVYTEGDNQALLLDTPGIHKSHGLPKMNQVMNKVAWSVLGDADFVCYLIDVTQGWSEEDANWIEGILKKYNKKALLLATKTDKVKMEEVEQGMINIAEGFQALSEKIASNDEIKCQFIGDIPQAISSKRPEEIAKLRHFILDQLPQADWLYAEDDLTDRPQKFVCAEIIREQIFRQLGQELPYKIAVIIELFEHKKNVTDISATIVVDRDSHKGIVIGKNGSRIKSLGTDARISLERHLERKVFLELFVKVKLGWTENSNMLLEFASLQEPDDVK